MERSKLAYHPLVLFSERAGGAVALNILWWLMMGKAMTLTLVNVSIDMWEHTEGIREEALDALMWGMAFLIWVTIDSIFLLWKTGLDGWRFREEMIKEWRDDDGQ